MGYGLSIAWLLVTALMLGFAYIVYIFANRESGNLKLIGQIIAWLIVILLVVSVALGFYWKKEMRSRCPMMGKGMQIEGMMKEKTGKGMMMKEKMGKMMEKMGMEGKGKGKGK